MYLRFYLDDQGKRVYTFKYHDEEEKPTMSAHPGKQNNSSNLNSSLLPRRLIPSATHEMQREI
jgi:hypothetical protein